MNKSILILEENSIIHGLIASALDLDGLTLHHEFDPGDYVQRAKVLMPDLILLSNADQSRDYEVCRELRSESSVSGVPVVLLANSRDNLATDSLEQLRIDGVIRKPFEASDLQQQVSKHLNIVDLIGSAYDYKKSQSLRDEGIDPLSDMEVLDTEILGFLQESAETAAAASVPEVDFSEELEQESAPPAEPEAPAAEPEAVSAAPLVDESTLEDTLQPERAFEPVEMAELEPTADEFAGEEISLEGADYNEFALDSATTAEPGPEEGWRDEPPALAEEAFAAAPGEPEFEAEPEPGLAPGWDASATEPVPEGPEGTVPDWGAVEPVLEEGEETLLGAAAAEGEALGEPGILEPEGPEEAALAPESFDQPLEPEPQAGELPLDDVEVELAGVEMKFEAGDEAGDEGAVALFETDLSEETAELEAEEEEVIPQAVRRMVELRPVLSKSRPQPAPEADFEPDDDELASMADELAELDEIVVADAIAGSEEDASAGGGSAWRLAGETSDDDEEFFHEDYLGDEEIDEDKIREALSQPPAEEAELGGDDEDDGFVAGMLEDRELEGLEAMEPIPLEEPEEDDAGLLEDLALEPDEETLVLSSIEQEEALTAAGAEAEEDLMGDEGLIDQQLEALEGVAAESGELLEQEPEISLDEAAGDDAFAVGEDELAAPEVSFVVEEDAGTKPESLEQLPEWGTEPDMDSGSDELSGISAKAEELLEVPLRDPAEEPDDAPFISDAALQTAAFTASDDEEAPPVELKSAEESEEEAVIGDSDFDAALRELQMEIESNPEGERLDDVLAQEGILQAVDELDFHIPRHEHVFTRAMGILQVPNQGSVDRALMERLVVPGAEPLSALLAGGTRAGDMPAASASVAEQMVAAGASVSGLHEEIVNRLGLVLDDVIRDTVRRVVREEMPQLMEQMKDDLEGHGR